MGVAGFWGAYLTEKAERKKELRELEKSMLTRLKKTKIGRASKAAPYILAMIDGLAPFFAALIVMLPFFFAPIKTAYFAAMGIAFGILFVLGLFLGKLSKENLFIAGLRMLLAGVICVALAMLVGIR
jgi:predicted membrane protein (TIGR00267 family)